MSHDQRGYHGAVMMDRVVCAQDLIQIVHLRGTTMNTRLHEALDCAYYLQYHAKQARYQYLRPEFYEKIKKVINDLQELDGVIESEAGIGGMKLCSS